MRLNNRSIPTRITSLVILTLTLLLALGLTNPANAQSTDYDNTYGSGAYGGAVDYSATLTPTPTPATQTSMTPTPLLDGGGLPDAGAALRTLGFAGVLATSVGVGLYGLGRRQRRHRSGSTRYSSSDAGRVQIDP